MSKPVETIKREAHIRAMHDDILNIGDERAEDIWLLVYPDGADEYDIEDMAEDDEQYIDLCKTYMFLMKRYGGR